MRASVNKKTLYAVEFVVTVDDILNQLCLLFQMHAMGIHSALAVKRQRKRRDDQKRSRERRYSVQSTESGETHSPHGSTRRKHRHRYGHPNNVDSKVRTKEFSRIAITIKKTSLLFCHAPKRSHLMSINRLLQLLLSIFL